jgi:hypothetical protein
LNNKVELWNTIIKLKKQKVKFIENNKNEYNNQRNITWENYAMVSAYSVAEILG